MSSIHLDASADAWWAHARRDLRAAEHLLQGGFDRHAAVLAHLAVEKALKAVYRQQHEAAPPASHDVAYLAEQITWPNEAAHDRARALDALGNHGVVALYPDQAFGPGLPDSESEARARLADAHSLVDALARVRS